MFIYYFFISSIILIINKMIKNKNSLFKNFLSHSLVAFDEEFKPTPMLQWVKPAGFKLIGKDQGLNTLHSDDVDKAGQL